MRQAFIRSLAFYVDGFFFGLIGKQSMDRSRRQQRYGDHWAHTIVIKTRSLPPDARSSPALGIIAGLLVYGSFQFLSLVFKAF
jgi:hypothetical protein